MITNMNCSDTLESFDGFSVCLGSEMPQQVKARVSKSDDLLDFQDSQDLKQIWPPSACAACMVPKYPHKHLNVNKKKEKEAKDKHYLWLFIESWQIPFHNFLQMEIRIFFKGSPKKQNGKYNHLMQSQILSHT